MISVETALAKRRQVIFKKVKDEIDPLYEEIENVVELTAEQGGRVAFLLLEKDITHVAEVMEFITLPTGYKVTLEEFGQYSQCLEDPKTRIYISW